jgi:hypothetical protein
MAKRDWRKIKRDQMQLKNYEIASFEREIKKELKLKPISEKFERLFKMAEDRTKGSPKDYSIVLILNRTMKKRGYLSFDEGQALVRLAGLCG